MVSLLLRSVDMNGKPLLTLPPVELASYSQMFGLAEARTIDNSGRKKNENGDSSERYHQV